MVGGSRACFDAFSLKAKMWQVATTPPATFAITCYLSDRRCKLMS